MFNYIRRYISGHISVELYCVGCVLKNLCLFNFNILQLLTVIFENQHDCVTIRFEKNQYR